MIEIHPLEGIGEISPGDDLAAILGDALAVHAPRAGDVLAVTQKIVSKAENRFVQLSDIAPGARALELAEKTGKDARLVELALRESNDVLRAVRGVLITRHKLGLVMANAGIDRSNVGAGRDDTVLLLPEDPDASAAGLASHLATRFGVSPAILITDSFGRPWRQGVVNVGIGAWGLPSLDDRRGEADRQGRKLEVTQIAYADLIASAAGLAMGEAAEGVPAALVRGLDLKGAANPATSLVRVLDEDLFR
ncbi:coenzyme F420-0:L-glutamate ligase [alpha proteobacterium U9-1i]|nr:coenzyme F420-0:L-glutamate ligase [alpha proteobacterium U9-1i]